MRLIDADALEKRFEYLTTVGNDLAHKVTEEEKGMRIAFRLAKYETHVAPTIEPKSQWIPVTDKLPEIPQNVIATRRTKNGAVRVIKASYIPSDDEGVWVSECGTDATGVIAWMPMPEPYKEDEHD